MPIFLNNTQFIQDSLDSLKKQINLLKMNHEDIGNQIKRIQNKAIRKERVKGAEKLRDIMKI